MNWVPELHVGLPLGSGEPWIAYVHLAHQLLSLGLARLLADRYHDGPGIVLDRLGE